jgi:hypothetical protein
MLQYGIKSFDLWKAKYDYVMRLSLTAYVPAFLDIIFTLLYSGQYVIKDTSLSFSFNVYCIIRDWEKLEDPTGRKIFLIFVVSTRDLANVG